MKPGTILGDYRLVEPLGSGGMGDVYVAEDLRLDRNVALKVLKPGHASDPERLDRFEREAKAIAAINHPNIVTIHSVERATVDDNGAAGDTVHFITMELVEGTPLSRLIPGRGFELDDLFAIAIPLVDAVSTAHAKGIAHRDLKPANILVTPDNRVKILDFGLAKLLEPERSSDSTEAATGLVTEEGRVMGTVAYMSPEQAEGDPVDHRTDIFSLGVLLYEMATGARPFQGNSRISLLSSVIKDEPRSITELNRSLPNQLGRIVRRCLEKAPERRFQTALDLKNELEDLRRELSLSDISARPGDHPGAAPSATVTLPRSWLLAGAALFLLLAGVVLGSLLTVGTGGTDAPPIGAVIEPSGGDTAGAAVDDRPSLAVLYFDNLSDEASLDWLRTGLTDMLVTDLAQSSDLRVLGTDRLYEILDDLGQVDARMTSAEVVDAVAAASDSDTVVLGSFMQAGETIRISARLQDADTGEVLRAESVEANDETAIFTAVDELTGRIRSGLDVSTRSPSAIDRDLTDITTDSVDAYREYAEGVRLLHRGRNVEAMSRFTAATQTDPDFAMAWAKLSVVSSNLLDLPGAQAYAERALEHADRLTERERLYIEGVYYSLRPDTVERSIEAYEELIALYPDDLAARNNVALRYGSLEQYDRAAEHLREALRRGMQFTGTPASLANYLCHAGRCDEGLEILRDFARRSPDYTPIHLVMADLHLLDGDLAAAEAALERFRERALPQTQDEEVVSLRAWMLAVLQEDWSRAEAAVTEGLGSEIAFVREIGAPASRLVGYLYRGRLEDARRYVREVLASMPSDSPLADMARAGLADWLADAGHPEDATSVLDEVAISGSTEAAFHQQRILAIANARLGRHAVAEARANDAGRLAANLVEPTIRRDELRMRAILDLEAGETAAAIDKLEEAVALLPPKRFPPDANHAPIWYELGVAHLVDGDAQRAAEYFRRILDAGALRIFHPVQYVRSSWQLGRITEARGDVEAARDHYRRFLRYWGDGDIDRERVEEARRFLREH